MPDESPGTTRKKKSPGRPSGPQPKASTPLAPVPNVMDIEELALYLQLSVDTLYKKVQTREIPYTKVGNLLRFPRTIIDTWLARNTVHPDEALLDRLATILNRYHFEKWLQGRGIDPTTLTEEQLIELARKALEDLRANPSPKP